MIPYVLIFMIARSVGMGTLFWVVYWLGVVIAVFRWMIDHAQEMDED